MIAILTLIIGLMVGWFFGLGTYKVGIDEGWIKDEKDEVENERMLK